MTTSALLPTNCGTKKCKTATETTTWVCDCPASSIPSDDKYRCCAKMEEWTWMQATAAVHHHRRRWFSRIWSHCIPKWPPTSSRISLISFLFLGLLILASNRRLVWLRIPIYTAARATSVRQAGIYWLRYEGSRVLLETRAELADKASQIIIIG